MWAGEVDFFKGGYGIRRVDCEEIRDEYFKRKG